MNNEKRTSTKDEARPGRAVKVITPEMILKNPSYRHERSSNKSA